MIAHRRAILYAALALAVPLPALALTGEGGPPAPTQVSLTVSASLDSCGTAADTIVCKIDATWNEVPGAERYTASVSRADGSVVDFGEVGAGGSSFWVPYVGNGTYTVTVSAYGTPPGEERSRVVAKGSSSAGTEAERVSGGAPDAPGPNWTDLEPDGSVPPEEPGPDDPAPEPEDPSCEEPAEPPVPEPTEPPAPVEPGATDEAGAALPAEAALSETAEVPESVECPPEDDAAALAP